MKHFTLDELCRSDTAAARGIPNEPTEAVAQNLAALVENVLDPLRQAFGAPVYVNSGYRCPRLNAAVGGVPTSHHLRGMAADITAGSVDANRRLFELARANRLPFCQLIDERHYTWLHISYDPNNCKRQVLHR